jgi:hypothetical protein
MPKDTAFSGKVEALHQGKRWRGLHLLVLFCLLPAMLAACSGLLPTSTPTPEPATPTLPATPTVVWFPATNTPTSMPVVTLQPTRDQRPGVGSLLFMDSFSEPGSWSTAASSQASASISRNQLFLSTSTPGPLSILSLRSEPSLGDFYAEVTVKLILCGPADQFGMIFHAAPGENYYRLSVSCAGKVRMERSLSGTIQILTDWLTSSDAPNAAPAQLTLGVWMVGKEIRAFLNGNFQFEVQDPVLPVGTLGFYAYANGAAPITVSFSELAVYSVQYTSPAPTLSNAPAQTPGTPTP